MCERVYVCESVTLRRIHVCHVRKRIHVSSSYPLSGRKRTPWFPFFFVFCFQHLPASVSSTLISYTQPLPTTVSKETYYSVKRDLLQCQKRPSALISYTQPLPYYTTLPHLDFHFSVFLEVPPRRGLLQNVYKGNNNFQVNNNFHFSIKVNNNLLRTERLAAEDLSQPHTHTWQQQVSHTPYWPVELVQMLPPHFLYFTFLLLWHICIYILRICYGTNKTFLDEEAYIHIPYLHMYIYIYIFVCLCLCLCVCCVCVCVSVCVCVYI